MGYKYNDSYFGELKYTTDTLVYPDVVIVENNQLHPLLSNQ